VRVPVPAVTNYLILKFQHTNNNITLVFKTLSISLYSHINLIMWQHWPHTHWKTQTNYMNTSCKSQL